MATPPALEKRAPPHHCSSTGSPEPRGHAVLSPPSSESHSPHGISHCVSPRIINQVLGHFPLFPEKLFPSRFQNFTSWIIFQMISNPLCYRLDICVPPKSYFKTYAMVLGRGAEPSLVRLVSLQRDPGGFHHPFYHMKLRQDGRVLWTRGQGHQRH